MEQGEEAESSRQISRPIFLDAGGFDGRQARNRQQADRSRSLIDILTSQRDALPSSDPKRVRYEAHIAGESLTTLKSTGRGRGAKGRWVNWRTNSQIRGELWRVCPLYRTGAKNGCTR